MNDPNGPLFYKGKYHLFFQNVEDSTTWTWGLSWGHATSTDLLHWRQQPPALKPEPGWHDADGCFSGCATIDTDGRPAILYTGGARRTTLLTEPLRMSCGPRCNARCNVRCIL